jgi:hypothetical protein
MMLPSTNAEKYLALIVYSTVVCILCVFLALILGDTLRMAFLWGKDAMFGPRYEGECYSVVVDNSWWFGIYAGREVRWFDSTLPLLVFNLLPDYEAGWSWYGIMHVIVWFVSIIWIHSLYTLGGTLLRKYAFVVASVVFILLVVAFVKIMNYFDLYMLRSEGMDQAGNYSNWHIGLLAYFYTIVLPILSIANYWISFRIFKGFELITNKWFNYDFHK